MRNVDKFNSREAIKLYRNTKIIYQSAKYGSKALTKVNPTLVFIDAVVSLGELFISYSNYRQAKEQNKRLEVEIRTISKELSNLKKALNLDEQQFRFELEKNSEIITKNLMNNRQSLEIFNKAYMHAKVYFLKMKKEVEIYRKRYPFSKETQEIEQQYNETLTLYLETTLEYIGG